MDTSKRVAVSTDLSPSSVKSFTVDEKTATKIDEYFGTESDLASFLIRAAMDESVIANFLYWYAERGVSPSLYRLRYRYLKVEIEANAELDEPMSIMYAKVLDRVVLALSQGSNSMRRTYQMLISQKVRFHVSLSIIFQQNCWALNIYLSTFREFSPNYFRSLWRTSLRWPNSLPGSAGIERKNKRSSRRGYPKMPT